MTDPNPSAGTSSAADRLAEGVGDLHVPEPRSDVESVLVKVGFILPLIGLVLIMVAWYGASGTTYTADQIPMLISGGLMGLGLAIIGLGLYLRFSLARVLRFWLARLVAEQQVQTDRIVEALARLEKPSNQ